MTTRKKILKSWKWKHNQGSDPCTYYCDVYIDVLDWYGESRHPLWKGPFDVGRQNHKEFLSNGPHPMSYLPDDLTEEVQSICNVFTKILTSNLRFN